MLDELRHLLLIVEHRTFTAAARHAHLSQPALSASVRRLEEELGARLLDRGRHGATLTAEGEALLPRAQAALAAFEDGRRAVEVLATTASPPQTWLARVQAPAVLAECRWDLATKAAAAAAVSDAFVVNRLMRSTADSDTRNE